MTRIIEVRGDMVKVNPGKWIHKNEIVEVTSYDEKTTRILTRAGLMAQPRRYYEVVDEPLDEVVRKIYG